ncbi:N-acetylglucosamine-6-phosphate deacetylase [Luteococcus sp. Sow4_B9]|uniref:N-acetylglucosamine-6-phosphate deacetylase n=1 Tax=Luteococcus sp. Sow4_B9 TaxID=3438792 RepID=UPI003F970DD5
MTHRIACARMVIGEGPAAERTLVIDEGRITAVEDGIHPDAVLLEGWVVPGFVDTHCHGAAGADFTDPDMDHVLRAILHHRMHGSTTVFASTVTSSVETLLEHVERLRLLVESGELGGIHIEGPFLAELRKGAHAGELLQDPDDDVIEQIIRASHGAVKMVTLAPERQHALEATVRLREAGIMAAFGHTDADTDLTRESIEAGMHVATHLFNAMRGMSHRDPGPIPVLLNDPRVTVELICDGVHVDREVIRLAVNASRGERVALVTDAMSACGHADGRYQLGAMPVDVTNGIARVLNLDETPGAIAGSTLTMDRAFAFLVEAGYPIEQVSLMASTNPARVHHLDEVGHLRRGAWADFCQLDDLGHLQAVMRRGEWLDRPNC